jgi:hypothetical protein
MPPNECHDFLPFGFAIGRCRTMQRSLRRAELSGITSHLVTDVTGTFITPASPTLGNAVALSDDPLFQLQCKLLQ